MVKLKIIPLLPGYEWPKAGVTETYSQEGRERLEDWITNNRAKIEDEDYFNDEYAFYVDQGSKVDRYWWCVVLDQEPVVNEWGIESP